MTRFVIGCDPGKATGIAVYDTSICKPVHMEETPDGIKGFRYPLRNAMFNHYSFDGVVGCDAVVVCEGFTLRSSNEFTADLSGVEIIGWLKGEDLCHEFPQPVQHMTLTRLRKNKDKYQDSKITHLMQEAGFPIGEGHTRMALSVAVWYAAKILKHTPTLRMLSGTK